MKMDDIMKLKDIPTIGPTLVDTLDIDNLLNINKIFTASNAILDVANSRIFCELRPGTDLNVPPANCLYPSVNLPNPINIKQKNEESASFYIANMFPECNHKVSIVAEAEVIKQLFKIPFNEEPVSLMVRKIGNILLIDNFDIANFSGNQEITEANQWSQVEEFIATLKELNTNLSKPNHLNNKLIQRNMFSKFLSRSAVDDTVVNKATADLTSADSEETAQVHKFSRIIYWTFENNHMLIGTNTLKQIFFGSGATRNVSLHVFDVGEPLKIANVIDIWLDNLICDIPEAVICFQLDGIVQHYECILTQDILDLLESQFSITKIKAYVQGIFSFLLNHEFQRSQIYRLWKSKDDNDLKFFNLNMLEATDGQIQIIKTPFDFECGKLFYRFGHYQYYSNNEIERMERNNTMLLEDSIRTLNKKIHPEIIATSNYLIVHLSFSYEIFKTPLFVKSKVDFQNCKKQPESVTKRCFDALDNINDGLRCLEYFCETTNTEGKILMENRKSNSFKFNFKFKKSTKQDEVIHINISSLFPKKEYRVLEPLPDWQNINEDRDYWKNCLKFLFYQKAELIFGILAQQYFYCDMFGLCLRSLNMMVRSNKIKIKLDPSSHSIAINPVLIMAGDCCQSFSTVNIPENSIAWSSDDNNVRKMENILVTDEQYYKINTNADYGLLVNLMYCSKIKLTEKAIWFYENSLKYEEMDFIRKKLFDSNLALSKLYSDKIVEARKQTNRLQYFEQSEKYINQACDDTARSPLDQASALFHRAELHGRLYDIYLEEIIISYSVENNLFVHSKKFLDSFKDALRILNTDNGDNEDFIEELKNYFINFINSLNSTVSFLKHEIDTSQIPENLRNSMSVCFVSGLKEILKKSELSHQRYKNDFLYLLTCAKMKWCIAGFLLKRGKIRMKLNETDDIRDNLDAAITSFSDLYAWKFYILVLYERSTYLVGKVLWTDIPLLQKMQNIKDALKLFCQEVGTFQKIIDTDFTDEFFGPIGNDGDVVFCKLLSRLKIDIKVLLRKGIELIGPYPNKEQEVDTFKNCFRMFESSIIPNTEIRLFLTDLICNLEAMCIAMNFVI